MKQIQLACAQYSRDFNGRLPPISSGHQGWAHLLDPYVLGSSPMFQCPAGQNPPDKFRSDFFLNAHVAGLRLSMCRSPVKTITFGEGWDNASSNSRLSELPLAWKTDADSPAQRHINGANYAWVYGHVKWILPDKISAQPPRRGGDWIVTFAVR